MVKQWSFLIGVQCGANQVDRIDDERQADTSKDIDNKKALSFPDTQEKIYLHH